MPRDLVLRASSGQRSSVRWSTAIILAAVLVTLLGGAILVGTRLLESPSLPPALLRPLAYAVDGDIYVAAWDGSKPVRIADGLPGGTSGCGPAGFWAEGPMWSPDGRYLAYRSPRSQERCDRPEADTIPTILISDPAGNVVAEVPGVGWRIPWSPDSTRFATWLDLYPSTRIGVYGRDGTPQAVLALPPSVLAGAIGDYDPIWSPDGSSILIRDGERETWELPLDGRAPQPVPADDPRSHWHAAYSDDGKHVAFIDQGSLVVAAADGSDARTLATDVDVRGDLLGSPVWSPSGDMIAVTHGVEAMRFGPMIDFSVIDVATGAMWSPVPTAEGPHQLMARMFSPDGDRILFARTSADGSRSLWSVDVDGSGVELVLDTDVP